MISMLLKKNNFVVASQSLGAHRQKSHFFENFVQQDENKGGQKANGA